MPPIDLSCTTYPNLSAVRTSPAEGRRREAPKRHRSPTDPSPQDQAKKTIKVDQPGTSKSPPAEGGLLAKPQSVVDIGSFSVINSRSPARPIFNKQVLEFNFSPEEQAKCQK